MGIAMYLLYNEIGSSIFAGLGSLVWVMIVNSSLIHFMKKYQEKQMPVKDKRVNLIDEVLNGIKVIKLYAWEKSFLDLINGTRRAEIQYMRIVQYLEALQYLFWLSAPILMAVVSFGTFVLMDPENNVLTAQVAFTSLTLFNSVKEPLFMMPSAIVTSIQGYVSLKRINEFLMSNELDHKAVSIINLIIH